MILYLVGFMGCGKSSLGRRIAERTGFAFADTDHMVEEAAGRTIPEIFATEGEAAFRAMESAALRSIPDEGNTIVATGGGTPCNPENLAWMKAHGHILYISITADYLYRILYTRRQKRPKLAGLNDEELLRYIRTTLAEREPYYSQASATIECTGASDSYIIDHILFYLDNLPATPARTE